jgi:S1-C subfamily serine protease
MKASIDQHAVCVITDTNTNHAIGSGFSFLKDNWIITAKHVVIKDGYPRKNIQLSFLKKGGINAKVLAIHPELDLALLVHDEPFLCKKPLMPGYHEFSTTNQLFLLGYSPSKSVAKNLTVTVNLITGFETEIRERDEQETLIHFKADFAESGNSGGAIIGEGGNVVAVAIQIYEKEDGRYCVATSIRTILKNLNFGSEWQTFD